ncbi:hypothetical protein [Glutamicibacter sp.]|uniref:hypothetical protein n=1 Tax=Glutamicibacter sp. TaxID=1931995 RepID=UPI002FE00DA9
MYLTLTIAGSNVELALSNPHGDVVATILVTGTGAGQGISGWSQYDEYGNQLSEPVNTGATSYGWHSADQRAIDTSRLTLMDARPYNAVTTLFASRDPVEGGNTTSHDYPQNPVGANDISGEWSWWDTADVVLTADFFIPGANAVAIPLRIVAIGVRSYRAARTGVQAAKIYGSVKKAHRTKGR